MCPAADAPAYPQTRKDKVVDTYHGVRVEDPYRWLEDAESAETLAWVNEQNERTRRFLADSPVRERIESRLTDLIDHVRYSAPWEQGGRYFFWKNDGLQNQPVLYVQEGLKAQPRVVINPNELSEDGTAAVTTTAVSWDGKLLAYGLSRSGSDEKDVRVRKIDSGREYEETLHWCRFTTIAWKHDGSGFFYSRYPDPNTVAPEDRMNYNRVYWHTLDTPQSEDVLVYERPDNKELSFAPVVTEDGRYLLLYVYHGTDPRNRIYYRPLEGKGPFVRLLDKADAEYAFIGNRESTFYFNTDLDAPRGRILAIDVHHPSPEHWRTVVPERNDVLDRAAIINGQLVLAYMRDVHHRLEIRDMDGRHTRDIPLPTLGTVSGLSGKERDDEMFFSFTSFLYPSTSFRYDFATGELGIVHEPSIDFDPSGYETKQVFYTSKDGTRVPMFLTHRKGLELDGDNPTLLYGYGGFNISVKPRFSVSTLLWLEAGGVFAQANLRGGSEYGEAWHQAGMLDRKQNVFDDFIAAAEWLIANDYTRPARLAIRGGSNGGLLVAACMIQRPELYGAVVCQVPVIDMLRYHKFTVGRYWVPEYGNAEASREHFDFLYAYSPLHNVQEGLENPPILVTSADTDDRVVPSHAKKFAATLQEKAAGTNPILLRVETKAGHGGGKPTSKVIEEQADIHAFLFKVLNVNPQPTK
jgi:prolyl oligopeptidase